MIFDNCSAFKFSLLNRLNLQENEERRDFIENLVNYEANNLIETSFYQMGGPNIG